MAILSADILNGIKNAEATNFDPIPEGEYTVKVSKTELKDTKDMTGKYINAELSVLGPKFQGRKIFTRFNIRNNNEQAMQIGQRQLKELMLASGMTPEQIAGFKDTDQLMGLTCNAKIIIREDKSGKYDPQNDVKRYLKLNTKTPAPAGDSFSDAFAPAAAPASDAPWFQ